MTNKELQQGTEEWLLMRTKKIGASDAAAILGLSPWLTPLQLFEIKLGYRKVEENFAMKRGKALEEPARKELEKVLSISLEPKVIFHPEYDFLMASLDACNSSMDVLCEIKCPGQEDHELAKKGKVPEHYYPQLQHQMMVANVPSMFYFSYTNSDHAIVEVNHDPVYQKNMLKKEKEFYECLRTLTPPDMTEKDYEIHDDEEWRRVALNYEQSKLRYDVALSDMEFNKEQLIRLSNNRNAKGSGIKLTKIIRKGNIDYSKIEVLKQIDLDQYRKDSTVTWRISDE